jgi:hypothetical protein
MQSPPLRVLQVIILAFASGLVAFSVLGLVLGPQSRQPVGNASAAPTDISQILLMALGAMGVFSMLVLGFFIRPQMARGAAKAWQERGADGDEAAAMSIWRMFQSRTIITGAMVEGFGLFAAVIHFLTGSKPALIGAGVAIIGLLWAFPTQGRWQQFVRMATGQR